MSANLMSTEAGGEQSQYEAAATDVQPHSKSGGQLGGGSTSTNENTTVDPSNTQEASEQQTERGEKTAENVRYGQTISEGGMGGMTKTGQADEVEKEGYGRVEEKAEGGDAKQERVAEGYGGGKDMNREIGA